MKLKQISNVLNDVRKNLNLQEEKIVNSNPNIASTVRLIGINDLKKSINKLDSLGLLKQQVNTIKNSILYQTGQDYVTVNISEGNSIQSSLSILKLLAGQLADAFSDVINDESENSVHIKLPDNISDFRGLEKFSHDIHIILNQTIIDDEIGGNIKIIGVENGSIWINILLGSSTAVFVLGSLAWAATVVYKKLQEGRLLAEQVKGLGIRNASVEEIQQKQKILLDEMVDAEANHIYNESYTKGGPEKIERIKHSIELLSKLIGEGTEIYPALAAPEQVANLFPDPKNLLGITSKIKQIGNE